MSHLPNTMFALRISLQQLHLTSLAQGHRQKAAPTATVLQRIWHPQQATHRTQNRNVQADYSASVAVEIRVRITSNTHCFSLPHKQLTASHERETRLTGYHTSLLKYLLVQVSLLAVCRILRLRICPAEISACLSDQSIYLAHGNCKARSLDVSQKGHTTNKACRFVRWADQTGYSHTLSQTHKTDSW